MDLKIEGPDLQKLLEAAVMQALGDAGREKLVSEVVRYLTTQSGSGYNKDSSPLMKALYAAAGEAAKKYVAEKMANDPAFTATIDSLYIDAFKKFNSADVREALIGRMSDRLESAFSERY